MRKIEEFDEVVLADGRRGAVVELLGDQVEFLIDVGSSPTDWETIQVSRADIARVLPKVLPAIEQEKRAI